MGKMELARTAQTREDLGPAKDTATPTCWGACGCHPYDLLTAGATASASLTRLLLLRLAPEKLDPPQNPATSDPPLSASVSLCPGETCWQLSPGSQDLNPTSLVKCSAAALQPALCTCLSPTQPLILALIPDSWVLSAVQPDLGYSRPAGTWYCPFPQIIPSSDPRAGPRKV